MSYVMIGAGGYLIWFAHGLSLENTPLIICDAIGAAMQPTVLWWAYRLALVSKSGTGAPGNAPSLGGAISPGGRYVFFTSRATNLVPGDTNGHEDVFVRDRRRGTTRRIDAGTHGQTNGDSFALGISAGGRYRLYESGATNIVPGDSNRAAYLFLRDRRTGRSVRVDLADTGGQGNHGVGNAGDIGAAMTPGARWVAFVSPSTNLVARATRGPHVYRRGPLY